MTSGRHPEFRMRALLPGFVAGLLLLAVAATGADTQAPPPQQHALMVVPDEDAGELYWPLSQPFYVRLATSPEEGAPSFLLNEVEKRENGRLRPTDQDGINLEMSGPQFIRWFNYVTQDTFFLRFVADGDPPSLDLSFSGATTVQHQGTTYYGPGLQGTVDATDDHSGIRETYISIDGAGYEPYPGVMNFTDEKRYLLAAYAVDRVGNSSEPRVSQFILDKTAPTTQHVLESNYLGNVLAPAATIRLESEDALSGVATIYAAIDGTDNFSTYGRSPLRVADLPDGDHILRYYAVDRVGNEEQVAEYSFYLDRTAPEVTVTLNGNQYAGGGKQWISSRTRLELTATDAKAGLEAIQYAINSGSWTTYESPISINPPDGAYTLKYRGVDRLQNQGAGQNMPLHVDNTAPTTKLSFDGVSHHDRGITWLRSDTRVVLTATDPGAGVRETSYRVGEDPRLTYSAPFTLANEGRYDLVCGSVDHLQNREQDTRYTIDVDNTPPSLNITFSVSPIGRDRGEDGSMFEVYPAGTDLFPAATDASSGTRSITYTLNGGTSQAFKGALTFTDPGEQQLVITATDRVGNSTEKTIGFFIRQ